MKSRNLPILMLIFLCAGCAPAITSAAPMINVYATRATELWLSELYQCAAETPAVLNFTSDAPDISLRLGEPAGLATPAFQIGTDDLLVVVNRLSPLQNMSVDGARELFAGSAAQSAQVWAYATGEDIQILFDQLIMNGRTLSPFARLAVNPQQMSDALNADFNAVGILPRRWKMGDTREIFSLPSVPVLAVTAIDPQGAIKQLIACMQR